MSETMSKEAFLARALRDPEGVLFFRHLILELCATFIKPLGDDAFDTGSRIGAQSVGFDVMNNLLLGDPAAMTIIFKETEE